MKSFNLFSVIKSIVLNIKEIYNPYKSQTLWIYISNEDNAHQFDVRRKWHFNGIIHHRKKKNFKFLLKHFGNPDDNFQFWEEISVVLTGFYILHVNLFDVTACTINVQMLGKQVVKINV